MSVPRVALATAESAWEVDEDAPLLVPALEAEGVSAEPAVWDDPGVDWSRFDLVVLRSTWDYTERLDEFLAWIDRISVVTTVANPAATIRWNTDKHYLDDLARRGVAVVPTTFLDAPADGGPSGGGHPHDAAAVRATLLGVLDAAGDDRRELVVKPTVSAGSKDTARYDEAQLDEAVDHARRLLAIGRDVMAQPYLSSVDEAGETGMVLLDGEFSHAFRKGALLRDGAADVDGLFAIEDISATTPRSDERELAAGVLVAATDELDGVAPRYARVDVLRSADGAPVLLELELTEPSFFLWTAPAAAARVARAVRGWA